MDTGFLNTRDLNINTKMIVKNSYGKREEVIFIYPAIVQSKEDFCVKHNKSFNNICHRLPSLKLQWDGCPLCQVKVTQKETAKIVDAHLKEKGMEFDIEASRTCGEGKGEWVNTNPVITIDNSSSSLKTRRGY